LKKIKITLLIIIAIVPFYAIANEAKAEMNFASAQDIRLLYEKLKTKGFVQSEIDDIFGDERKVLEYDILKGGKKRDYSDVFYQESIERGKKCLSSNNEYLTKLEQLFGVPKNILVSIYRVETNLGQNKGKYLVTNSLFTLWFVRNRRSAYFGDELVNWLFICKNHGFDYYSIIGSSAGAFGLMQFMPTSFLDFAVDGNEDGRIDLFEFKDAMASAANYLKGKGWRNGSMENNRKVILRYNSCEDYSSAVIKYAKKLI
jgi:membrane-bound lytic murein transglycosylase B